MFMSKNKIPQFKIGKNQHLLDLSRSSRCFCCSFSSFSFSPSGWLPGWESQSWTRGKNSWQTPTEGACRRWIPEKKTRKLTKIENGLSII